MIVDADRAGRATPGRLRGGRTPARGVAAACVVAVLTAAAGGCGLWRRAHDPEPLAPPGPSAPFVPADAAAPPGGLAALAAPAAIDPARTYDLPSLVDLAERTNPRTRRSWEQARQAAAALGLAESAYLPTLTVLVSAGYSRVEDRTPTGPIFTTGPMAMPGLGLEWIVVDFGRRDAARDAAAAELLGANLRFDRTHQEVAFAVQRTFYAHDAALARVDAALATLASAASVRQEADARGDRGLATQTEILLARQEQARAAYEVEAARRSVADSHARLTDAVGVVPTTPLTIVRLAEVDLPPDLQATVEQVIETALARRPDLAARLAELRAREADERRAEAAWWPTVGFTGSVGGSLGEFTGNQSDRTFDYAEPVYGSFLRFSWTLFDGFARDNRLREAAAQRGEAAAALTEAQLAALREVWTAYADVKAALLQYRFAQALLAASNDAYQAALTSYRSGLASIVELLAGERDLARARMTIIETRAEVLRSSAALAFAAGALPGGLPVPSPSP